MLCAALGTAVALPSASATSGAVKARLTARSAHIAVNGHRVYDVRFQGQVIPLGTYMSKAEPTAERSGRYVNLVVDRSAVGRGYFVAFTDKHAAARYMRAHGMGTISDKATNRALGDRLRRQAKSTRPVTLDGTGISLAACSTSIHFAFFYDGLSCGGSDLSMVSNDAIPSFSTYGFDNKTSSLDVGDCIANVSVWTSDNYDNSSNHTTFGGDDFYNEMPLHFDNSISSAKTDSSPC
jgi:hypothetical protein